jgi:2-polyprenyl-6-methoxyphenol hydroxylase-like FAD-dependent oxidoreductase
MATSVAKGRVGVAEHVVVVGGGIGGLGTALALGRAGHRVTVLERDVLPAIDDPDEAFAAERRGAPQVHQTHGFLARLQVVLRDRFPDVFEDLMAAGCTTMSTTANLGEPRPGDEDLKVLIVRRTTLEWVLRRAALAQPGVEIRSGVGVSGLVGDRGSGPSAVPTVTGVRLDDGTTIDADLVVAANGRRAPVPAWLGELGVDIPETIRESGLMYVTRWYRLPPTEETVLDPKLGGDLGFVKYLGVPGDRGTLSVTLAIRSEDAELRAALCDDDRFDLACRALPGPDGFFAGGPLEPIGPVRPMGGLLNRIRTFVDDDGSPTVLGFHAVGDAHTCTNPLYGRGCALAMVQAVLLADALAANPDDAVARGAAYEAASAREVTPWFQVSVEMDKLGADPAGFAGGGGGADSAGAKQMAAVFVAAATDPIIGRAMVRFWNLMATPAEMMTDPELLERVMAVMADPDAYPVPPREGPTRTELLDTLTSEETAA